MSLPSVGAVIRQRFLERSTVPPPPVLPSLSVATDCTPWGSEVSFVQSAWNLTSPNCTPQEVPPSPARTAPAGWRKPQAAGEADGPEEPKLLRTAKAIVLAARTRKIRTPAPISHHIEKPRRPACRAG